MTRLEKVLSMRTGLSEMEIVSCCFPPDKVKKTGRHFDNVSIGEIGKYAEK